MKVSISALLLAGAFAVSTTAFAQTDKNAPGAANPPGSAVSRGMDHTLGTNASGTNPSGSNTMSRSSNAMSGPQAAGGNDNQAVATTSANATHPARGSNSFTRGQAKGRISNHGFQDVKALHLNSRGVWWGRAMKDGQPVKVWLDYKGNVGQS